MFTLLKHHGSCAPSLHSQWCASERSRDSSVSHRCRCNDDRLNVEWRESWSCESVPEWAQAEWTWHHSMLLWCCGEFLLETLHPPENPEILTHFPEQSHLDLTHTRTHTRVWAGILCVWVISWCSLERVVLNPVTRDVMSADTVAHQCFMIHVYSLPTDKMRRVVFLSSLEEKSQPMKTFVMFQRHSDSTDRNQTLVSHHVTAPFCTNVSIWRQ